MSYILLNAQFSENEDFVTNMTVVGQYDSTSAVVYRSFSDLIWCDGITNVPLDIRNSTIGCPHEDRFDRKFVKGEYLLWGICAFFGLVTAVFAACIWRTIWNRPLKPLNSHKEIEINDVLVMTGIAVELLQYLSIGPDLSFITLEHVKYIYLSTLDLAQIDHYQSGSFHMLWIAVTACVCLAVAMSLIVLSNVDFILEKIPCVRAIGDLSEIALYFAGNWLFIPIISILLEVFVCVRGVGLSENSLSFTDSYLHANCYEKCRRDTHVVYAAVSSLGLLIYVPGAIVLRPLWQEIQSPLNVKTLPAFLLIKSVMQIWLIILSKTVKLSNPVAHSFLYLGFFAVFLAFTVSTKCYNYKRPQLWLSLSHIAVLWAAIMSLVHNLSGTNQHALLTVLLLCGWVAIAAIGLVYQLVRVPSLLYRKKGVDTRPLFRFAFKYATSAILTALFNRFVAVNHRSRVVSAFKDHKVSAKMYEVAQESLKNGLQLYAPRQHEAISSHSE